LAVKQDYRATQTRIDELRETMDFAYIVFPINKSIEFW